MDEAEKLVEAESLKESAQIEASEPPGLPPERSGKRDVRSGLWTALIIGFGSLIVLIALFGYEALDRARAISGRISQAYQNNLALENDLAGIRSHLQMSAILVRDYLLDRTAQPSQGVQDRLLGIRDGVKVELTGIEKRIPAESAPALAKMKREIDLYWAAASLILKWTPEQKAAQSSDLIKTRVSRRAEILDIVSQIEAINQQTLARQRQEVELQQLELPIFVRRSVILTILVGFVIAGMSLYWINRLEKTSQRHKLAIEKAGHELRRLSQQLVHAQEEERKKLSHELHDEVGQLLTALRIELGNLDEPGKFSDEASRERIADTKRLAEQALRTVRDLAMGLRPAMLDELGLIPALQWQGREHSRRTGIPVSIEVEGAVDEIPEEFRTCVYRVVQEALTNIARHASARCILIGVAATGDGLAISVKDDGIGFDSRARTRAGLGLLGMAERVKKLGGRLDVVSRPGNGTSIMAHMPLKKGTLDHEETMRLVGG